MLSFQFKVRGPCTPIQRYTRLLNVQQRFEHSGVDKLTARKIESRVRYPATINMAEFTTLTMKAQEKSGRAAANPLNMP